eukprot:TRINITY_DN42_c0_g2_i2.p1 TRINITY_DN42_c0_g2~~TRINITY_DN42_c0_g2_i2.p1  ORF type:complete len:139 (+),score=44.25 TRINITY_DN42_c0_g2_i2:70-486(+)
MAMTGVSCLDECVSEFDLLKTNKSDNQGLEYAIDGNNIKISNKFAKGTTWSAFLEAIPKDDARYYVWDLVFEDEGVSKSKLLFITWNPDAGKVKSKMLYAGSKDALKKKIEGGLIEVQANGLDDLDEKEIGGRAKKGF